MGQETPRHLASILEAYLTRLGNILGSESVAIASPAKLDGLISGVATAFEAWAGVRRRETDDEAAQSFETVRVDRDPCRSLR